MISHHNSFAFVCISLHILWHDASHVLGGVFLTPTFIILHTLIHILYQCLKIILISSKIVFQSSCNRYCETYNKIPSYVYKSLAL